MQSYICFLRGVNITGHNKIRMADLTGMFKESGFNDAETYIQSGNVVFTVDGGIAGIELVPGIESAIRLKFGFEIAAMIRTPDEIRKIITVNPFLKETNFDPSKSAVIFLYEKPVKEQLEKVRSINYPPDKFEIIGKEIFIYCPNGFGRTKLYTNFFENKMKIAGTARNWNTINTILGMAERKQLPT